MNVQGEFFQCLVGSLWRSRDDDRGGYLKIVAVNAGADVDDRRVSRGEEWGGGE